MTIQNTISDSTVTQAADAALAVSNCESLISDTESKLQAAQLKFSRAKTPRTKAEHAEKVEALSKQLESAKNKLPTLEAHKALADKAVSQAKKKAGVIASGLATVVKALPLHDAHVKAYKDAADCLADSDTNEFERVNAKDSECKLFAEHVDMQNATDEQVNSDFQSLLKDLRSNDKKGRGPLASWLSLLYRKSVFSDGTLTRRDKDLAVILKLLRDRTPYRIKIQKKDKTHTDGTVSRLAYVKITYKPEVTDKNVTEFWKPIPTKYWEKPESLAAGKNKDGEVKPFESTDEMLKAVTKVSDKIDGNKAMALDASYNMLEQNGVLNHFPELRKALEAVQAQKFQEDSQAAENTQH